ncbi:hypothetical protein ACSSV5_002237 [Psychroflexus sp. MBR-150]|jgi:hypothetical protein
MLKHIEFHPMLKHIEFHPMLKHIEFHPMLKHIEFYLMLKHFKFNILSIKLLNFQNNKIYDGFHLLDKNFEVKKLIQEANELVAIFVSSSKTVKKILNKIS